MYGVPKDLPLNRLVNYYLAQVRIGVGDVQFHFANASAPGDSMTTTVCVSGRWEIRDTSGKIIDEFTPHDERTAYRVHVLLNLDVSDISIEAPYSFSITFSGGLRLRCFDDPNFEAITIYPDEIII